MMQNNYHLVIDYRSYIAEQAGDFYGRAKVLSAISEWLASDGPRFFAIIGPPGSGKTAIAARLAQFAQGDLPAPSTAPSLGAGFLSAFHFCPASDLRWTGDLRWFQPQVFANSLSRQLATRYREFGAALVQQASRGRITITSNQVVDTNNGQVIGVNIQNLDLSGLAAEDAFSYSVREPLETLLVANPTLQIVFMVDALDEAQRFSGRPNIVSLITQTGSLSPRVRFIVTARPGLADLEELASSLKSEVVLHRLDEEPYLSESLADVSAFFVGRARSEKLQERLSGGVTLQALADMVSERSNGNFLYATQISQMLRNRSKIDPTTLDELPEGLAAFYRAFLKQTIELSKLGWATRLQPTLGTLAVAQEAHRRAQLAAVVRQPEPKLIPVLKSTRPVLDQDDTLTETKRTYSFYHRSFADFLLDPDEAKDYWCEAAEQHERIAGYYVQRTDNAADPYGRRYVALHLAAAALGREQPARHKHTTNLVNLVRRSDYEHLRLQADGPAALGEDQKRALQVAAADNHRAAPALVLAAAAKLLMVRKDYLAAERVLKLAEEGRVRDASQLLDLLPVESKWRQATLLAIAWAAVACAAAESVPRIIADATVLLKQVADNPASPAPIPQLARLVDAVVNHTALPPTAPLPPAPDEQTADMIVERIGGGGIEPLNITGRISECLDERALNPHSQVVIEAIGEQPDSQSIFAAAQDGPLLVAYADNLARQGVTPRADERFIDLYIDLQAANNYVRYRNGSLWLLLDSVLRHHDPNWVREHVVRIVAGALAGSRFEYQEGVPLTLLALRARAGIPGAAEQIARIADQSEHAIATLMPLRGRNDIMGTHTRRLGVLAQIYTTILDAPKRADAMLNQVLHSQLFGYAGLYAPAVLTLAEAIRICRPNDRASIDIALGKARRSAHRVQDSPFCAQTTARWNALARRWWAGSLDAAALHQAIHDLNGNPTNARFSALHIRGEAYDDRPRYDPDQFPIANWVLNARSLSELAAVYERPLAELERVNPGDDGVTAEVNVPDREFQPLLAAYLSAEALVVPELQPERRAELIQLLVPVAAHNPTALDIVLTRLLIAAHLAGWVGKAQLRQFEEAGYPGSLPQFDERTNMGKTGELPVLGDEEPLLGVGIDSIG